MTPSRKITITLSPRCLEAFQSAVGKRGDVVRAVEKAVEDRAEILALAERYLDLVFEDAEGLPDRRPSPAAIQCASEQFEAAAAKQAKVLKEGRYL